MAKDDARRSRREAKRHRIFFKATTFSPESPENVPDDHQDTFRNIQALGSIKYASYGEPVPTAETADKPWQRDSKGRAVELQKSAVICRKELRNEAGWREEIEYPLFRRFKVEVAW